MAAVRDRQPLIGDGVPGLLYVGVEFDAMNEMGATQRGSNVCNFSMKDGKVIGSEVEDLVKASEHVRALMNEGRTGKDFPVMRSEEHTSELQSLMRRSYAVFCLKKKKKISNHDTA